MAPSPSDTDNNPSAITSTPAGTPSHTTTPSAITAMQASTAVYSPTSTQLEKFTHFPSLPKELRLDVWGFVAPTKHDALMGARITSNEEDNGKIDHGKIFSPLLQPHALAGRKSCKEAFDTWNNATISTIFMPLRYPSLSALSRLGTNVDAIATLWPEPRMLDVLFLSLQMRDAHFHLEGIKTFLVGVTAIVCDPIVSPKAFNQLGEMRFKTFELDDPALLNLLDDCDAPRKVHASNKCFIRTLQEYWERDQRNEELRETWQNLMNAPNGEPAITMKPVAIANTPPAIKSVLFKRNGMQNGGRLLFPSTPAGKDAEGIPLPPMLASSSMIQLLDVPSNLRTRECCLWADERLDTAHLELL
ncbi:hypothetical protein NW768_008065 [Fusarium equiseti]|uniref:Uncharacterized protein n=1 Tax=Fusarium equiseti TaxID=61235 RepID=A0ABQ8R5Z9_FUSEQ|nr:hypothetical protein NW768_008065 [Fusarium equiseti]